MVERKVYRGEQKGDRHVFRSLWRGLTGRCPSCASHKLFAKFLKVHEECPHCREHLGEIRADDAPPYFTIAIVGHIIVPSILFAEKLGMSMTAHMLIWPATTLLLTLLLMQPVKGGVIGVMWANGINGDESQSH